MSILRLARSKGFSHKSEDPPSATDQQLRSHLKQAAHSRRPHLWTLDFWNFLLCSRTPPGRLNMDVHFQLFSGNKTAEGQTHGDTDTHTHTHIYVCTHTHTHTPSRLDSWGGLHPDVCGSLRGQGRRRDGGGNPPRLPFDFL